MTGAGSAFGECLVRTLPLSWTVAIDEQGAELAVRGDGSAAKGAVLYPANAVAKRWVAGEDGAFIPGLWAEAARVLAPDAPGEASHSAHDGA